MAAPGGNTGRDVNGDGKPDGVTSTVATDAGGARVDDYVSYTVKLPSAQTTGAGERETGMRRVSGKRLGSSR